MATPVHDDSRADGTVKALVALCVVLVLATAALVVFAALRYQAEEDLPRGEGTAIVRLA